MPPIRGSGTAREREHRVDPLEDLGRGHHLVGASTSPSASSGMNSMKRTPTPLLAPERGEVDDLVVVDAADHDAVDLHRVEAGVERGVDAGEHPVEVVAAGERAGTPRGAASRARR